MEKCAWSEMKKRKVKRTSECKRSDCKQTSKCEQNRIDLFAHPMERPEALLGFRRRRSKNVCPASLAVKQVCRECASKRWRLTQTNSRIGFQCGKRLGDANWNAFVRYAESEFKADFFDASEFGPVGSLQKKHVARRVE